jgi:hypothetical protein
MTEHGLLIRILLIYRHLVAGHASGQPVPASHVHDSALIIHDYIEAFHEERERRQRIASDGGRRPGRERNGRIRTDVRTARSPRGHGRVPGVPGAIETDGDRRHERFADLQTEQFGRDGFAAMVGRVAAIEHELGIYDLAQFTPPNITPSAG